MFIVQPLRFFKAREKGNARIPRLSHSLPKSQGRERTNSSSCEAAVLAKPKARFCEPWDQARFDQRSPRSGRHLRLEFKVLILESESRDCPVEDWSPLRGSY